jgi:spore coat polysaccharide biosynthesis protein SpsF (cytidylyltransferase family)
MASSRFPGKVLADLAGHPMLWHVVRRVRLARRVDEVVVATSVSPADDPLAGFCDGAGIALFRGNENDVLDRVYQAAAAHHADTVVRITADCTLIDPDVMERVLTVHASDEYDYVSNVIHYTYPDGLDVEAMSVQALAQAWRNAMKPSDREHVTPYLRFSGRFHTRNVAHDPDLSHHRWTIDEPADLEFVRGIYAEFGAARDFRIPDILDLLARRPELQRLQRQSIVNDGYYKSLYSQADDKPCRAADMRTHALIDYTLPNAEPASAALGRRLQDGFNALAKHAGLAHRFECIGDPVCSELRSDERDGQRFREEAARLGIFVDDHHHLTSAHDVTAIEETLVAYAAVFKRLARQIV